MQLTDAQRAEIERQRREQPDGRVQIALTADQADEYRRLAIDEDAGQAANLDRIARRDKATAEPGFSGDLRRALKAARRPPQEVAATLGIDVQVLEDFRAGEATLPSDVVDRLVALLGLRLMAEIP